MITTELLQQAKQGNNEAFTQIYNETIKTAYYVAKRILVDESATEDVLQEAYIAVYQHLDDYKEGNFQGWVDTIVANRAKNYLRKQNPILFSQMETEDNPIVELEEENIEFRPEEHMDYTETKRLVMEMVDALSPEQRLSVILFYFEQKSVKEIAEVCECTENTVKSRLNYARQKLKDAVLELEKKGTKLYCGAVIPFLYWMLREEVISSVVPETTQTAVATGVQNSMTQSATRAVTESATQAVTEIAPQAVAGVATKAGLSLGAKIAIGIVSATIVLGGGAAVAVPVIQNIAEERQLEESEKQDKEEGAFSGEENREENEGDATTTTDQDIANVSDAFYKIVSDATKEGSVYENEAVAMAEVIVKTGAFVMEDVIAVETLSDEQRANLNYGIVNTFANRDGKQIASSSVTIPEETYGTVYDNVVLDKYLEEFYQSGKTVAIGEGLKKYGEQSVYKPADGDAWIEMAEYVVRESQEYVFLDGNCYEVDNTETKTYKANVQMVFKITKNEHFPLQIVYIKARDYHVEVASITASSQLPSGSKTYGPENMLDFWGLAKDTAWVENVDGVGIGETITIDLGTPQVIHGVKIYTGYQETYKLYDANGKVTEVSIDFGNGKVLKEAIEVPDFGSTADEFITSRESHELNMPETITTDKIIITITGAIAGSAYEDTAITQIDLY